MKEELAIAKRSHQPRKEYDVARAEYASMKTS
jgi:hypothetical protein